MQLPTASFFIDISSVLYVTSALTNNKGTNENFSQNAQSAQLVKFLIFPEDLIYIMIIISRPKIHFKEDMQWNISGPVNTMPFSFHVRLEMAIRYENVSL